MDVIKAFIGHSFDEDDKDIIGRFLKYFDSLKDTMGFEWEHAEKAEAMALSKKVRDKMEGKNLFIGIFTQKGLRVNQNKVKMRFGYFYAPKHVFQPGASEWIIQESGYGLAKCGSLLFLIEEGVNISSGLQGDIEYIQFSRERPELCFTKLNEIM